MDKYQRIVQANQVFTPGYPVSHKDLFAGRMDQLQRVLDTLGSPGRHPVLFGQRGVGKTSLANVLGQVLKNMLSVKISCDGSDTFSTVWNRVLLSASVSFRQKALGFTGDDSSRTISLADAVGHDPSTTKPAEIADLLRRMNSPAVVILDEFDKLATTGVKAPFADLIKIVSDTAPLVTIVLVGVAENIHELVGEHASIVRNLVHVELPLMSDAEIQTIYTKGLEKLRIPYDEGVVGQVARLSGGFPHYAHLLGLSSVKAVVNSEAPSMSQPLFDQACTFALADAIEKYRDAFARATATTQLSRYPKVLAACGYAAADTRGVFRATDVVEAFQNVFSEVVSIQAIVPALGEFLLSERAEVLRAVAVRGRQCYQFRDPMMRPYCRLKSRELMDLGERR
jgi:energy-coupling factor transporter ATP-binding protein EcfA2